jgi:hypothetical protein
MTGMTTAGVLRALALVKGCGISGYERVEFAKFVGCNGAAIEAGSELAFCRINETYFRTLKARSLWLGEAIARIN